MKINGDAAKRQGTVEALGQISDLVAGLMDRLESDCRLWPVSGESTQTQMGHS